MGKTVSEDVVRLAMRRTNEKTGFGWLSSQIIGSIAPALSLPWILDIDETVRSMATSRGKPGDPATSTTAISWRVFSPLRHLKKVSGFEASIRGHLSCLHTSHNVFFLQKIHTVAIG